MKTSLPVEHLMQWRDENAEELAEYMRTAQVMLGPRGRPGPWQEYVDNVRSIYEERIRIIDALIEARLAE